jgi:DNA-binding transcriptional MerR regulator
MRIGALAQAAGISVDTVRYYERRGLLAAPPRSANGYREYGADALARLRLIRAAAAVGFTLIELRRVLLRRDQGAAPCAEVVGFARAKAAALRGQERELRAMRRRLEALLLEWEARLAREPGSRPLRFLEALATAVEPPAATEPRKERVRK